MKFCERKDLIDRQSYVAQYVSLALLTIGTTTLLGSDDLLAAFTCGTAFAWDGFFNRQTEESVFSSVIDLLFNVAAFVYVGAWMPFSDFSDATLTLSVWRLIVIGILVLLLRRLPVMIALYKWIPDVKTFREAIFSGHFGPMGIGKPTLLPSVDLPKAHSLSVQALSSSRPLRWKNLNIRMTRPKTSSRSLRQLSNPSLHLWFFYPLPYTGSPSRSSRWAAAFTPSGRGLVIPHTMLHQSGRTRCAMYNKEKRSSSTGTMR